LCRGLSRPFLAALQPAVKTRLASLFFVRLSLRPSSLTAV
jgi:hypothetical protein